jgi:hypothetical protein
MLTIGVWMRVRAMEEKVRFFQCPYCLCYFCSKSDLERHLKAFGDSPHLRLFKFSRKLVRGRYVYCVMDEEHWLGFDCRNCSYKNKCPQFRPLLNDLVSEGF